MFQNRSIRTGSLPAFCLLAGSPHVFHRSETMSHAFTFRWMGLTRPQRGFTCVRPIGLSLACGSGESELLDIAAPASYPAVTSDALGVGNRLEHWPEAVLPAHSLDATSCRTSKNPHYLLRQGTEKHYEDPATSSGTDTDHRIRLLGSDCRDGGNAQRRDTGSRNQRHDHQPACGDVSTHSNCSVLARRGLPDGQVQRHAPFRR